VGVTTKFYPYSNDLANYPGALSRRFLEICKSFILKAGKRKSGFFAVFGGTAG
jgi:hypothetical protein